MRLRIAAAAIAAVAAMAVIVPGFVAPALAQTPQGKGHWVGPPNKFPTVSRKEQVNSVDFLFGALKAAPDDETARAIEQRIWALWMRSRSDTATLLMTRAQKAIE